jgi:hypothetical protein
MKGVETEEKEEAAPKRGAGEAKADREPRGAAGW